MSSAGKIGGTNGGGYIHNAAVANSFSLSSENMILTGALSVSGTITVDSGSTLVVVQLNKLTLGVLSRTLII